MFEEAETQNNTDVAGSETQNNPSTEEQGTNEVSTDNENDTKNSESKDTDSSLLGDSEDKADDKPVEYSDFTIPEGNTLDGDILQSFKEIAGKAKLTQEDAQKIIDLSLANSQKALENQQIEFQKTRENWVKEIKEDKEFGGINFQETVVRAKRAIEHYGDDNIKELLNASGLGDNPSVIKMFARIDKKLGEDTTEIGNTRTEEKKSAAEVLFPKSTQ